MKKQIWPLVAVLIAIVLWGLSFLSIKVVVQAVPPATAAWIRQFPSLLTLLFLVSRGREKLAIARSEWLVFGGASLFGIVLYSLLENTGMQYTSPNNASMLVAAIPVFVLLIESIQKRKKPDALSSVVILLSIVGVWLILFEGGMPDLKSGSTFGNLLVMGSMACWILYTFISQKLGSHHSTQKIMLVQTLFAIFLYLPLALAESGKWQLPSLPVSLNLIFLGVFCSAAAYVLYFLGIQALGPVLPSALLNLLPVVTIVASLVVLGERPTTFQVAGALLIMGSLSVLSGVKILAVKKAV